MQVDECLTAWKTSHASSAAVADPHHRCVVCTLPYGECQHSKQWLESRDRDTILDDLPKDCVEQTIDDLSDVLRPGLVALQQNSLHNVPPSFSTFRWTSISSRATDEVSGKIVDLSSPPPRVGHTMVQLYPSDTAFREVPGFLVMFGGLSVDSCDGLGPNNPLTLESATTSDCALKRRAWVCPSEVCVFDLARRKWGSPGLRGDMPHGRYGHVALAIKATLMWVFGGREQDGSQDGDTYVLDMAKMSWERTNAASRNDGPSPPARLWSAATKIRGRVIMFGGTDLLACRMFNDVWTWDIETRCWADQIVVGAPPFGRYGHALLTCSDERVLVLGGCCVSTDAEKALPADADELQRRLEHQAEEVVRAHDLEEAEVAVGLFANYAKLLPPDRNRRNTNVVSASSRYERDARTHKKWRLACQRRARLAATLAAREKSSAAQGKLLRDISHEIDASAYWATLQSRNPLREVDATYLDTENMIWSADVPQGGTRRGAGAPSARMLFSAVVMGSKVVMWGGCSPTAKRIQIAEGGVHVFDTIRSVWSRSLGRSLPESLQPRADAARRGLRRAERLLHEAKQRALTLGAPGGRTVQVRTLSRP